MKKILFALVATVALVGVDQAKSQIINFTVSGSVGAGGNTTYVGQGAAPDSIGNTYWNQIGLGTYTGNDGANEFVVGGSTGIYSNATNSSTGNTPGSVSETIGNYLTDGSTASAITVSTSDPISLYAEDQSGYTNGTPGFLLTSFSKETSAPVTFTLNNVAAGTYNLYLYGENGHYGTQETTFTASTDVTAASSLTADYSTDNIATFVNGQNYVEFTNLLVGAGGSITFSYVGSGGGGEGDFNGLQLQDVPTEAVPEPSTWALMLGGVLGLLLLQRRTRKVN